MILLVNPLELKYLEDLLLLRIPLTKLAKSVSDCLNETLPLNISEQTAPQSSPFFSTAEIQPESIPVHQGRKSRLSNSLHDNIQTDTFQDDALQMIHAVSNPSALPIDMFGIGNVSPTVRPGLWYHDARMLAACQLMYRSLIGYYSLRSKELKIRK